MKLKKESSEKILQYSAAITACLTIIGYGCTVSWTSPSLPHLTSENSEFPVSKNQASWIASLVNVGMIIGYILNALIIDKISRKKTLLLLSIPQISASILIILAKNWIIISIARIIIGIGYGGGLCAAIVYLGEIGDENSRGIFLVMIKLSLNLGIFIVMLLGAFFSYNQMNFTLLFLPLIFIVFFPFLPDSFYFLEKRKRKLNIKEEIKLMKFDEPKENVILTIEGNLWEKSKSLFFVRNNRRAFFIVSLIFATEALSGHAAVMAFTQEIFDFSAFSLSAENATLILAGMKIISTLISTQIVEKVNRKSLFLFSGIFATIAQSIVAIFFLLKVNLKIDVSFFNWIPLFGITMYEVFGNAGIGSLAFVYSGELFPPEVKGVGITLTNIAYEIVAFFVKLQFRVVVDNFGIAGIFFLFTIFCVIGTGIVFYLAPETRGKSLEEIQEIMNLRKRDKRKIEKEFSNI